VLPLLAIIYWGIKMIFWFRSRDGVISLIALVLWFLSLTALVIILAGQGLSFSQTGHATSAIVIENPPDTIYVVTSRKIADLKYNRDLIIPDNAYAMYANTDSLQLSIRANVGYETSGDKTARVEIVKTSLGTGIVNASRKAESLPYNYKFSHDTLYIDEYFTLPRDRKWSGDEIETRLFVPDGTILWFEKPSSNFSLMWRHDDGEIMRWEPASNYQVVTSDGLHSSKSTKVNK
jgi:hypothetical protein